MGPGKEVIITAQIYVSCCKPRLEIPVGPHHNQLLVHLLEELEDTVGLVGPLENQQPVHHRPEHDLNVFRWDLIRSKWSKSYL